MAFTERFRSTIFKSMLRRATLRFSAASAICLLVSALALAQGARGTISGQVTDASGAVIAGATVSLKNVATQQQRTVVTDNNGSYQFLEIEPATYNLTVSAKGFSDALLQEATLEPSRHLTLDVSLKAAGVTEQVSVTAGQELIDRESATLGTTVDNKRVVGLPLNGRNILDLALLQPGVAPVATAGSFGSGEGFRVNGARAVENNFTLDGSNNNEIAVGSDFGNEPRPDAVQEFRVLTGNYDAEYGRDAGSVINVVVKGGTNRFHGDARLFYRPTFLSAGRFFDNMAHLPVRRFERKEIGGNFGGPLDIPHVYNGKDKTFFFFDFETRRQLVGNSQTLTGLPTVNERNGIFSHTIVDPATGKPFPNNTIDPTRISPIAKYYLNFIPIGDASGRATVQANEITNNDYITARLDHQINSKQTVNFIANYFQSSDATPFAFGGANVPGFGAVNLQNTYNYVFHHTYAISSTLINSFLISYVRNNSPAVSPVNTTTPQQIGFTANFVADAAFAGPPNVRLLDRGLNLGNTIQGPQARISQNFQLQDSVSWVRGNHRFKFGFDGTKYYQPQVFLFINQGILNYTATAGGNTTGDDLADFMIGEGPIATQFGANGQRDYRQLGLGSFAQDTWKVKDNLTLSLGVRWEYVGALLDKGNRVAYYRPGEVSQLLTSGQLKFNGVPIVVPAGGKAPVGLVFPGDPDPVLGGTVPNSGVAPDYNNFAPRLGISYSPKASSGWRHALFGDNQTVIRAGYGIFYGAQVGDTALQQLSAPGFNGTNAFFFPSGGTLADPFAPDPFHKLPQTPNPFAANQFFITAPLSQFSRPIDPHIRTPYTHQYNLTVERAFHKDYVVSLSYVGNRGVKLYAEEQLNPALGTFFPADRAIPAPNANNANSRRLNNDIHLGLSEAVSAGNSWYNAFQAQIQKRYSNGLLLQAAYTFSKSIDDSDTLRGGLDLLNRAAGRGLSSDDIPQRFVLSWIYDLPFAKHLHGATQRLLDGFSFGGIATFSSGTPFTVGNPFDTVGTGGGIISEADLGAAFQHMDPRASGNHAFNSNAFQIFGNPATGFNLATDFRRGTEGINQFRLNNGINNWNLIVSKKTRLWNESSNLELRFEMFNAFNHTQFSTVDLNLLHTTTFGEFTDTRESRIIQLGARISF